MQDKAWSVSQINNYLKNLVEADVLLSNIFVQGEISNFKQYSYGGQWYFTLKDNEAQINCVVFQNFVNKIKFIPKDGESVIARGKIAVFNKRGTYNLQVFWLEPTGLGKLARDFEALKQKLEKEGLFAQEHKKQIPKFPKKIAVLAAPEGAAVHDIITVSKRRNKSIEIKILPTIVQGVDAVESIIKNIDLVQKFDFDVLILARGGGSLEDLWAFNEEAVARKIFNSTIPVVSAIGHEIDFTIADFVADLRAATPSVAAELVVPDLEQNFSQLEAYKEFLLNGLERLLTDQYQQLGYYNERMQESFGRLFEQAKNKWQNLSNKLEMLNPLSVLSRGYALVEKDNRTIFSAKELLKNDIIKITLAKGAAEAEIRKTGK